jgi:Na+-driven multidrug efflux pump
MLVSLLMNTVNIIGNAICIFGLKMGVAGVAIPTLIARALAAVIILGLLQNSEGRIASLSWFRPSREIIRNIMSIGIPNGIESGLFQFGKLMLQSLVSTLGTASIAAYAVASNLVTYLYLPGNALGAGMLTIVGQCLGAGKREQARDYAKMLIAINYGLLAVICTIMIVCRGFFVSCYMLSPEAAELAKGLVLIHSIAMIIWPLGFLLPHYFRATGRAALPMGIAMFSM